MMLLLVMLAGGLGSGSRYLVGHWAASSLGTAFPYATMIVNVLGCFALGAVFQFEASGVLTAEMRTAIAVGFLGGFTTYSSFNQETLMLLAHGATGQALINLTLTLLGCMSAGLLGMSVGRALS